MKKTNKSKTAFLVFGTIIFLLFTRWVFSYLELREPDQTACLLAELVVFGLVYALSFLSVPFFVPGVCALIGCAMLCVLYRFSSINSSESYLFPFTYLQVFLFYVHQLSLGQKGYAVFRVIWSVLMYAFTPLFGIVLVRLIFVEKLTVHTNPIFDIVLYALVGAIYSITLNTPVNKNKFTKNRGGQQSRKTREHENGTVVNAQYSFVFAVLNIVLTCVFFLFIGNTALMINVAVLWLVNIVLLYDKKNPFVMERFTILQRKISELLR